MGIIAGALGGLAGAAGDMARGYIEDERKLSVAEQLSKIEEARQMRIAEQAELRRREGRQADTDQDIANAPRVAEAEAGSKKVVGKVENDLAVDRTARTEGAKNDAERKAAADYAKDPSARAGARAAAQDKAVFAPGTYTRAEAERLALDDEKKRRNLLDRRADIESGNLRGGQRVRALKSIDQQLAQLERTNKPARNPELDTQEIREVTYSIDPASGEKTGERVTTRKEVRVPPKPPAGAPTRDPTKLSETQAHEQARAAVARGASREAVNKRLAENGFKPI
jgi:hypothetical protein